MTSLGASFYSNKTAKEVKKTPNIFKLEYDQQTKSSP